MNKRRIWYIFIAFFCLELVLLASNYLHTTKSNKPNPAKVQVGNPIVKVESINEMEEMLDFTIPVLDKPIESYTVIVIDQYPSIGRIHYEDSAIFSIQYGTGDISGIYGGEFLRKLSIDKTIVSFYKYNDIDYALWERKGFTYSLTGNDSLEMEVTALISK